MGSAELQLLSMSLDNWRETRQKWTKLASNMLYDTQTQLVQSNLLTVRSLSSDYHVNLCWHMPSSMPCLYRGDVSRMTDGWSEILQPYAQVPCVKRWTHHPHEAAIMDADVVLPITAPAVSLALIEEQQNFTWAPQNHRKCNSSQPPLTTTGILLHSVPIIVYLEVPNRMQAAKTNMGQEAMQANTVRAKYSRLDRWA